ncbi:glycoside hydrolase family 15 protein [Salmonirosea aquatica]|uniref:Glycoside hydrolase family 15 protein n=1 Tax=Salmonirosea aquatica TaxID=2654236 RepID=A0A7C9FNP8_9BACT|nr:glycoside hydrolase family 15 protein [Cytophagaceae bacterium SJW1-29]
MTQPNQPEIRELGIIGDQRTCALLDKKGTIAWYCPARFDNPALFASLLDTEKGGFWEIEARSVFQKRGYLGRSSILRTKFDTFTLTDWMPYQDDALEGVCRLISESHVPVTHRIRFRDNYGLGEVGIEKQDESTFLIIGDRKVYLLSSSHSIRYSGDEIRITIPPQEVGWVHFSSSRKHKGGITSELIGQSLADTLHSWEERLKIIDYTGAYAEHILNSCRAVCLMTHAPSGGIVAAATTSLPESSGSGRNYDYRYVWLRDSAMIASAHIRAVGMVEPAVKFLEFLEKAKEKNHDKRFVPFYDLGLGVAPPLEKIPLRGYKGEKPVVIGNDANHQLQLDANANVLLAAKLIYAKRGDKPHWKTVHRIADFVADNWHEKDHGIWEEGIEQHFTSSKVIAAKALEFIAVHAETEKQANKWNEAARQIRAFVDKHCLTRSGAYAVYAGSQHVDVTAALYPVWLFCEPNSPEMVATMQEIECTLKEGELYHRRLELFDSRKEGVFLAASLWVAQYYVMLDELEKARRIIDAALEFANDLGYLAEEGNVATGEMLGNFPQTFVHASLMGVIVDLNEAEKKRM